MAKKPTYEEIEQRLKELKQENCELRRLQDTFHREKENFQIFTANSPIGVSLISRDGKYLYINPKFIEIFGYTLEDVPTGKDWFEKAYPDIDYRLKVTSTWISDLKESKIGKSRPRIFIVTCRDGSKKVIKFIPVMLETKNRLIFYEDITKGKETEEALRASEGKYRLVVNNARIGIVVAQAGCLKFVNPVVMNISGYSEKELTDRPLVDFVHPDDREMVMAEYMKRLSGEKIPKPYELRIVSKEGKIRWVENSGVVISWEGQPATLNFFTDITEQKLIEEALRQNEKRFQKIVESAPFGYCRLGKDRQYQYVNPQWESMHGLSGREIIGKSVDVTEADENKARVLEYFHRALDGQTIKGESKRILKNGSYGYHEFSIQPVYQSGEIVAIECFLNDLTEQKRNEDLVRNLSHLLMEAQERERQMISYELHDRIAQNLSTLKIECTMLFEGQPAISRELEEKIARMSKLTEITITSVRDLAYNLRPPGLNEMSIVKAVEIYCEEFSESSGLGVDFQSTGVQALNFDYDTKIHIYRLVQEGLNNIRKHADASRATVKMIGASPNIILRIEDNGKGFDVKERERSLDSRKRMGLRSMQERVNLLGGQMTIRSRPMAGTKIFIKFPFEEKESD
jgi:PAS domain S-box-containing protein